MKILAETWVWVRDRTWCPFPSQRFWFLPSHRKCHPTHSPAGSVRHRQGPARLPDPGHRRHRLRRIRSAVPPCWSICPAGKIHASICPTVYERLSTSVRCRLPFGQEGYFEARLCPAVVLILAQMESKSGKMGADIESWTGALILKLVHVEYKHACKELTGA